MTNLTKRDLIVVITIEADQILTKERAPCQNLMPHSQNY